MNPHDRDERGTRNMRLVEDCLREYPGGRTMVEISKLTGLKSG